MVDQLDIYDVLNVLSDIQKIEDQIQSLVIGESIVTGTVEVHRAKYYELKTDHLHIPFSNAAALVDYMHKNL